jgi:23S rRNA (cytosine1962-C5)-methyltransferase
MDLYRLWPDFREAWIVYRDEDVIVISKPAGVSSQAADPAYPDDIVTRLKRYLATERALSLDEVYLGVHQRLDKETSGLILYTLRKSANPCVAAQFEGGTVEKSYFAALLGPTGRPLPATLSHYLTGRSGGSVRLGKRGQPGVKQAVTTLKTVRTNGRRTLLQVRPKSGRTHQIRVQLAAAGAPVAGDRQYGGAPAPRLMLHAVALQFLRPADRLPMTVQSPPPPAFARWIEHGMQSPYRDLEAVRALIDSAVEARWGLGRSADTEKPTTAFRLIHGAGDGLPGLAVDVYDRWLVTHLYGGPAEEVLEPLLDLLHSLGFEGIYLKRHPKQANLLVDTRDPQLAPSEPVRGRSAPADLKVFERGLPLIVRLGDGLRTGLFLDQRENRRRVRESTTGLRVLNLFAYTGGFSAAAIAGKAERVVSVDDSTAALSWCERNVALLPDSGRHRVHAGDVFDALAGFETSGERYDLVVVDPPSYSTTRARRFRVIDDLGRLVAAAMRVTDRAGRLLVSVNHRGLSAHALRRHIHSAARLSGRTLVHLKDLPAQSDFPIEPEESFGSKSALAVVK